MPVPKRRHSKSRGRKRRSHNALSNPGLSPCPRCHELRPSHRVCPHCGFYGSSQIIQVKVEEK